MEAGWYSDPNGGSDLRWWDGSEWTQHTTAPTADVGAGASASPPEAQAGPTDGPGADAPPADAAASIPPAGGGFPPPGPTNGELPAPGPAGGEFPAPAPPSGGYAPPGPASGGFPPPGPASGAFPPAGPPQNDSSRYLLIGLVALIVVLLGVGGVVLVSGGGDGDESATETTTTTEETAESTTTTTEEETTTTTAGEPDSEFISSGGLSFTRLPEPWRDWAAGNHTSIPELQGTAGQFVVVQELPTGGQWIGNLLIGDLVNTIPYGGEADLPTATHALADSLVGSHYVEGAATTIVNETAITVDGRPGYFIHHEVAFTQEGLETTREKVIVVVVDTGRARPGAFWASIPYNRADLNSGMDEVYASLQVND